MYHACQELSPPVELSVHLTVVATKEQDLEKLGPCHQAPAGLWGEDPPGGEVEKGHFSQNSGFQTGACIRITWRACEYRWVLSPTPRVSVSGLLEQNPRICIANSSQLMLMPLVPEPCFENHWPNIWWASVQQGSLQRMDWEKQPVPGMAFE